MGVGEGGEPLELASILIGEDIDPFKNCGCGLSWSWRKALSAVISNAVSWCRACEEVGVWPTAGPDKPTREFLFFSLLHLDPFFSL